MWPQDQGLLIPHQVVLRLQLVKKGKGMNGLGLPAGKGAQRDKSCPLEWFHSQTLGIFTGKVKSPGVPLVSSPPHHSELHSAGQGPSLGPGSTNYLMEMGMQPPPGHPKDTSQGLPQLRPALRDSLGPLLSGREMLWAPGRNEPPHSSVGFALHAHLFQRGCPGLLQA